MNETGKRLSPTQRALWVVAVAAALTGPLLGLGAFGPNSLLVIATVAAGWLAFFGGLVVWSRLSSTEAPRLRLKHAAAAIGFNVLAILVVGLPLVVISAGQSDCPADRVSTAPFPIAVIPVILYFGVGYFGFTRARRLLYAWPLAIASALLVLLVSELIWGCT